jgi:xanthine/uracil permease
MNAPREVKLAIALSWTVLVMETADRLWRISINPDANTFTRLRFVWTLATMSSTMLVAIFIISASRRHNWGRIGLLVSTFGGWCLWYFWTRSVSEYLEWQRFVLVSVTAMELAALILLFRGKGAAWYRSVTPEVEGGA